jgi:hypothetical protein
VIRTVTEKPKEDKDTPAQFKNNNAQYSEIAEHALD